MRQTSPSLLQPLELVGREPSQIGETFVFAALIGWHAWTKKCTQALSLEDEGHYDLLSI